MYIVFFTKSNYGYCEACDTAEFTKYKGSTYSTNGGDGMGDPKMNITSMGRLLAPLHYTHQKNTACTYTP